LTVHRVIQEIKREAKAKGDVIAPPPPSSSRFTVAPLNRYSGAPHNTNKK